MLGSEEQGDTSGPFISQIPSTLDPGRGCIQGNDCLPLCTEVLPSEALYVRLIANLTVVPKRWLPGPMSFPSKSGCLSSREVAGVGRP